MQILQDHWTDWIIVLFAVNIIAIIIVLAVYIGIKNFQIKRGQLSGIWYGEIWEKGVLKKKDEYKVQQRGNKLFVTGKRIFPYEEMARKWNFNGIFKNRIVTGYYDAINPLTDSFGCILLKANTECTILTGYYMTLKNNEIDCVNYKWIKK